MNIFTAISIGFTLFTSITVAMQRANEETKPALLTIVQAGKEKCELPLPLAMQSRTLRDMILAKREISALAAFDGMKSLIEDMHCPLPEKINMDAISYIMARFEQYKDKIGAGQVSWVEFDCKHNLKSIFLNQGENEKTNPEKVTLLADLLDQCFFLDFKNGIRLICFHLVKNLSAAQIVQIQRNFPDVKIPLRHCFYLMHAKASQDQLKKLQDEATFSLREYRDYASILKYIKTDIACGGKALVLTKSGIKSLGTGWLADLDPTLKRIQLGGNFIKSLKSGAFKGLTHVQRLDLSHNQISILNGALKKLIHLTDINLSSNNLSEFSLADFPDLPDGYLATLNLKKNPIIKFDIKVATKLENLYLPENTNPEIIEAIMKILPYKTLWDGAFEFARYEEKGVGGGGPIPPY